MRILLCSIHGLFRGGALEIGRDADNGGQIIYVMELARTLSQRPEVDHVHLLTRLIDDPALSDDYAQRIEKVNDKFDIRRVSCGGKRYLMKESIWQHLDEFVTNALTHIKSENIFPDWMHSHYGDAAYVTAELSAYLHVPFVHTAHSLGKPKLAKVLDSGMEEEEAYDRYQFEARFEAENRALADAEFICTSTSMEIGQFSGYEHFDKSEFHVIPPGIDYRRFFPYYEDKAEQPDASHELKQAKHMAKERMDRFLADPGKPLILAICRPDRKKNITGLIEAFGTDPQIQAMANLAIFAGIRGDIANMPNEAKEVLTEILLLMDKHNLYGKLAIPKQHDSEWEVPEIYRLCARQKGVFVNIAHHEPFGLTILEASACGLPIVATNNGGPNEIIPKCENGILVGPSDTPAIQAALRELLADEDRWNERSLTGVRKVDEHYSWESHVDHYLKLVKANRDDSEGWGIKNIAKLPTVQKRLRTANKMIVSDIDGTLVSETGDYSGLEELKELIATRDNSFIFGIATGRSLDLTREVIEKHALPQPDLAIASVGSYVYYGLDHNLRDKGWEQHLAFRWDRNRIFETIARIPGLEPQEDAAQNPFKISFFTDKSFSIDGFHAALGPLLRRVNVIFSRNRFLDILPKRASKGRAIRYLCQKWSVPLRNVIVCGDSGNDLDMFTGSARGIVVGNHAPELEPLRGMRRVHFSTQPSAGGVLDGLRHFKFF